MTRLPQCFIVSWPRIGASRAFIRHRKRLFLPFFSPSPGSRLRVWAPGPLAACALTMLVPRLLVGFTVYRIGGDSLPPPAEVGDGDAAFVFVEWEDIGKEGAAHQLDIGAAIKPRQHDPHLNLVPQAKQRMQKELGLEFGLPGAALDGDLSTAWQAEEYFFLSYGDHIGRILCDEDGYSRRERVSIDLGAELLLERIRIVSGLEDPRRIARDFKVSISPVRAVYLDPFSDEGVTRRIPFWALPRDLHVTDNVQHVREVVVPAQHRRAIASPYHWENMTPHGMWLRSKHMHEVSQTRRLTFPESSIWEDGQCGGKSGGQVEKAMARKFYSRREADVTVHHSGIGALQGVELKDNRSTRMATPGSMSGSELD